MDKSSPLLATALNSGEQLTECVLDLYRYTDNGSLENYYTITLRGARVVKIEASMNLEDTSLKGALGSEWVSFSYNRIEWRHKAAGTYACDGWDDSLYSLNRPAQTQQKPESPSSRKTAQATENSDDDIVLSPTDKALANSRFYADGNVMTGSAVENISVQYMNSQQDIAVLNMEEAKEFYSNLWQQSGMKDNMSNMKPYKDLMTGVKDAHDIAQKLGALGVIAYTKMIKGKEYIILKNYKKAQKTLLAGNIFKSNNPKVLALGLGKKGAMNMVKVGFVASIIFASALDAVDFMVNDKTSMEDLAGNLADDLLQGVVAVGLTALTIAAVPLSTSVIIAGGTAALISFIATELVAFVDNELGIHEKLTAEFKKGFPKL